MNDFYKELYRKKFIKKEEWYYQNKFCVYGDLYLDSCTSLTTLSNNLEVGGTLYLRGCTSLKSIPKTIKVGGEICRSI